MDNTFNRSQEHGFTVEYHIKKIYNVVENDNNNTSVHDIEKKNNIFNKDLNVSIKPPGLT